MGAVVAVGLSLLAGKWLWKSPAPSQPSFQRLTFRRGIVDQSRFSPNGRTILYSARWDGDASHIYLTRSEGPESQRLELPSASLMAISPSNALAVVMGKHSIVPPWWAPGTLATAPLAGGAPREIANDVQLADWAPDGKAIAVIRQNRLEFPIGKVVYEPTSGQIAVPRVSPRGDSIAFLNWEGSRLHVVDLAGKERFVSPRWDGLVSLAWNPSGDEIWFTAGNELRAVTLSGKERLLLRLPRGLTVDDISRDGRILSRAGQGRFEVWTQTAGETRERDVTVLGTADGMGISGDGKTLLINDVSAPNIYLRRADGAPPTKLGEGLGSALSPDGRWVVVVRNGPPPRLVLVPTGAGEEKTLDSAGDQ